MVEIPMKVEQPVDRGSVMALNERRVQQSIDTSNVLDLNRQNQVRPNIGYSGQQNTGYVPQPNVGYAPQPNTGYVQPNNVQVSRPAYSTPVASAAPAAAPVATPAHAQASAPVKEVPIPALNNAAAKGQKLPLERNGRLSGVKACFGWNVKNAACDVDVSAFLLGSNGKVLGDDWFVFYGQETSPDGSVRISKPGRQDREEIAVNLSAMNSGVAKIVFVLTIDEALQKRLNFSMIKDAYIRIMTADGNTEIVSFMMDEYYANVTSMMIGEMYLHNGEWKFNAVGNGVAKDLQGLCELYGVQVN